MARAVVRAAQQSAVRARRTATMAARDAHAAGIDIAIIAGRLGVSVATAKRMAGVP